MNFTFVLKQNGHLHEMSFYIDGMAKRYCTINIFFNVSDKIWAVKDQFILLIIDCRI